MMDVVESNDEHDEDRTSDDSSDDNDFDNKECSGDNNTTENDGDHDMFALDEEDGRMHVRRNSNGESDVDERMSEDGGDDYYMKNGYRYEQRDESTSSSEESERALPSYYYYDDCPSFISSSHFSTSENDAYPVYDDYSKHHAKCECENCTAPTTAYYVFLEKLRKAGQKDETEVLVSDDTLTLSCQKIMQQHEIKHVKQGEDEKVVDRQREYILQKYKEKYFQHKCYECGQTFPFNSLLERHWRENHEYFKQEKPLNPRRKDQTPCKMLTYDFFLEEVRKREKVLQELKRLEKEKHAQEEQERRKKEQEQRKQMQKLQKSQPRPPGPTFMYPMLYPVYFVVDNHSMMPRPSMIPTPHPHMAPVPSHLTPVAHPHIAHGPRPHPAFLPARFPPTARLPHPPPNQFRRFACGACHWTFTTENDLNAHMEVHRNTYKCEMCRLAFPNQVDLKRHYRTHTAELLREVGKMPPEGDDLEIRSYIPPQMDGKERESDQQAGGAPVERKCDICTLSYFSAEEYKEHMKTHLDDGEYFKCCFCGITFLTNDLLRVHMKTHTDEIQGIDENEVLRNPETSQTQASQMQMSSDKKGYREVTDSERELMSKKELLKLPMEKHTCEICKADFKCTETLAKHKRIHEKKKHECEECGARFASVGQKRSHVLTHTGERPFKCDLCDASFIQQGNLKRHRWTHTGERPHVCTVCSAGFLSTGDLKRHSRVHTGERPYKCIHCMASFTTSGNLKTHVKSHDE